IVRSCVMGPHNQKDGKRENDTGGCKNQLLSPHATGRSFIGEPGADARQERGRNFGVGRGAQAFIHRRKERLFLGESGAASGAGGEVRAQFALWHSAGGSGFD
ncbi:MAG: hypothetical protein WAQ77_06325, partial [Candidatus Acidiferrum sp.]